MPRISADRAAAAQLLQIVKGGGVAFGSGSPRDKLLWHCEHSLSFASSVVRRSCRSVVSRRIKSIQLYTILNLKVLHVLTVYIQFYKSYRLRGGKSHPIGFVVLHADV